MTIRRLLAATAIIASVAAPMTVPAIAHEGHAHGSEEPKPVVATAAPTLETSSSEFELVAVAQAEMLLVYLDRFATNEPVNGATIEVKADGEAVTASPVEGEEGVYRLQAGWLLKPLPHELTISIMAADAADLLIGSIIFPLSTSPKASATPPPCVLPF